MIVIRGLSPNVAYKRLLEVATQNSWPIEQSRVGPCRDLGAVAVELGPGERTILLSKRGWNPAFAIVEAAWVVAGKNDVNTLAEFIKNFRRYSDDGETLQGAYGYRLRHFFGFDQIESAISELKKSPSSRRVLLSLYSPADLGLISNDIPCNTQVVLRRVAGKLEMTVFNRSNDLWFGVPYNWFVFSVFQHLVANRLGIPCGIQRHLSTCLHLYEEHVPEASSVVACNQDVELDSKQERLKGLDINGLLRDAIALSNLSFDSLSCPQLVEFFRRFKAYQCGNYENSFAQDVLSESLDLWNLHREWKRSNVVNEPLKYNGETAIGLRIQRWLFDTPTDVILGQISDVARRASPMLLEDLSSEFNIDIQVGFKDEISEWRASFRFVLELIYGTIDPELVRTVLGDNLRERIEEIAAAARIEVKQMRIREANDERLIYLFGPVIN